jgi:hypothetical protein
MAEAGVAVLLLVAGVAAFALSIKVGMLVGQRLDRVIEARAAAADTAPAEEVGADE